MLEYQLVYKLTKSNPNEQLKYEFNENSSKIILVTNKKKAPPIKLPTGKYLKMSLEVDNILRSNIIITNKNSTAIAPTYIIINNKAKNSHSNKNNNPEAVKKFKTRNKTE